MRIELPGFLRVLFAGSRERGGEEIDLCDAVAVDNGGEGFVVECIEGFVGAFGLEIQARRFEIGGDDVVIAVNSAKGGCEFGADLSRGADDQDMFLAHSNRLGNEFA